ncbi:MAG TPA: hypothetical protein VH082_11325, partial [Rudaea sp.]|nr:hypothetical protein [Rudaea sp.]
TSSSDQQTYLYMTNSSILLSDGGDYQGHITAIDLASGTQVVFNAVCSNLGNVHIGTNQCMKQYFDDDGTQTPDGDAGIWGRPAATYDPVNDSIYISTGNGAYDPKNLQKYGNTWGDSVLKLPAAMSMALTAPLDSYTPPEYLRLMENDNDLGSTSVAIIPTSMTQDFSYKHIGIQSGKDSNLRILDLDDLSVANGPLSPDDSALFVQGVNQGNEVKTQPLIWQNPSTGAILVIVTNDFGISATQVIMDGSNNPQLSKSTAASWVITGMDLSHGTSAGGGSPIIANGVLYYVGANGLTAIDPATGTILANKTEMGISTSSPGNIHKQSPIVVNGRVLFTDEKMNLWVYEGDDIFNDGFEPR